MQVSFEHRTTILVATSLQAPSRGSSMTANMAGLLCLPDVFLCTAFRCTQACCKASSTGLLQSKQYRFAAKQAVQVCCKASSTGLLQSNWVCCKAIKQFPAEQAKVCCWKLASLSEAVCEEWSALCELLRGTSLVNWLCHFLDQVFRALSLTLWEHTLMEFVNLTLGV